MQSLESSFGNLQLHSLWEKDKNGFYENIFSSPSLFQKEMDEFKAQMSKPCELVVKTKDNAFALKSRNEGNLLFAKSHFIPAMENYNRSLCFAENGSEHIALAYANRSNCYFKLKMYKECLIDIELAKKANYPEHLMPKLEKRKDECLKAIAKGKQAVKYVPKLSYEPHAHFPGMANVLEMKVDKKNGRHVVALKDLKIGDTILLEDIYVGETIATKFEKCAMCLKSNVNLIPCSTCTFTLLCHDRCKNFDLHRFECGFCEHPVFADKEPSLLVISVIRSILMAITMFESVDELIKFVENVIPADGFEIPSFNNDQSVYRAFLLIGFDRMAIDLKKAYAYYASALEIPKIASTFSTEKQRQFLMHLVCYHYVIIVKGIFNEYLCFGANSPTWTTTTSILKPFFKISCIPNVVIYSTNGSFIGKVVNSIKPREMILVPRVCLIDVSPLEIDFIMQAWKLSVPCKSHCQYCQHNIFWSPYNTLAHKQIIEDLDYLLLNRDAPFSGKWIHRTDRKNIEKRCLRLLSKYSRMQWCPEITFVVFKYIDMMQRKPTSIFGKFRFKYGEPVVNYYLK